MAKAEVIINNTKNTQGFEVAQISNGELWHFGTYSTEERAREVVRELGGDAIVARLVE